MRSVRQVADLRELLAQVRRNGESVGLVPTMGALHEGHLSLIDRARLENDIVVVSVFVNPTQFRPGEDLEQYPRRLTQDGELAAERGADIVFAPNCQEVYGDGHATTISVSGVSERLCGDPERRGREHFDGVATVVTKLFNMVQPDRAYFGQKDAQQLAVIERLVSDLDIPVQVVPCPTVREPDGLAMSSRNAYLSPGERTRALAIWDALNAARAAVADGERNVAKVLAGAGQLLAPLDEVEYFELVDPQTMRPVPEIDAPVRALIAARCGGTRLIDNLLLEPASRPAPPADGTGGPVAQSISDQSTEPVPQGAAV